MIISTKLHQVQYVPNKYKYKSRFDLSENQFDGHSDSDKQGRTLELVQGSEPPPPKGDPDPNLIDLKMKLGASNNAAMGVLRAGGGEEEEGVPRPCGLGDPLD